MFKCLKTSFRSHRHKSKEKHFQIKETSGAWLDRKQPLKIEDAVNPNTKVDFVF